MNTESRQKTVNTAAVLNRSLRLSGSPQPTDQVEEALMSLPGMVEARFNRSGRRIKLRYDVTQTRLEQILQILHHGGRQPNNGVVQRAKLAWYRFTDETLRENARAGGGACCSNPADVYARRQKH